jgi:hypothetical protein
MPNQRKKGKRHVGAYWPSEFVALVDSEASRLGVTRREMMELLIRKGLEVHRHGGKKEDEIHGR